MGHADARTDHHRAVIDPKRLAHFFQDAPGKAIGTLPRPMPRQDKGEFVAAKPRDEPLFADHAEQHFGAGNDQTIADGVAIIVVDELEAIEIDQAKRDILLIAEPPRQF